MDGHRELAQFRSPFGGRATHPRPRERPSRSSRAAKVTRPQREEPTLSGAMTAVAPRKVLVAPKSFPPPASCARPLGPVPTDAAPALDFTVSRPLTHDRARSTYAARPRPSWAEREPRTPPIDDAPSSIANVLPFPIFFAVGAVLGALIAFAIVAALQDEPGRQVRPKGRALTSSLVNRLYIYAPPTASNHSVAEAPNATMTDRPHPRRVAVTHPSRVPRELHSFPSNVTRTE